jgi:DnaK suppressor protein
MVKQPQDVHAEAQLDEALEESFPASDPAANTVETGILTGELPSSAEVTAEEISPEVNNNAMDIDAYKQRLLALQSQLSDRVARGRDAARAQVPDSPGDIADGSVADEGESEDFTEAELDATVLQQVRDALQRIDDGTYGRCVVDGGPIEQKRLDAVPWTPYCLEHQTRLEPASPPRTRSL